MISMKEKLMEQLDRKLEQVRKAMNTWADSADMAIAFYNQALGAVEFAGWLVYQENPELEQEIIKMWNDEYRIKFEEIIWGWMKCGVLNVRATTGTITRKWKSATPTLIGLPLVNTMMNPRRKKRIKKSSSFFV